MENKTVEEARTIVLPALGRVLTGEAISWVVLHEFVDLYGRLGITDNTNICINTNNLEISSKIVERLRTIADTIEDSIKEHKSKTNNENTKKYTRETPEGE